jgi:hypothetical protein
MVRGVVREFALKGKVTRAKLSGCALNFSCLTERVTVGLKMGAWCDEQVNPKPDRLEMKPTPDRGKNSGLLFLKYALD